MDQSTPTPSLPDKVRIPFAEYLSPFLLWAFLTGLVLFLYGIHAFDRVDDILYDRAFIVRNALQKGKTDAWRREAAESIAILTVDDLSLDLLGIDKAPTRDQWARVVQRLGPRPEEGCGGAALLAFDYYLPKLAYPPRDLEAVNRNLAQNATRLLDRLAALSLGSPRPASDIQPPGASQGVLDELGLVPLEYQDFLRSSEDPRYRMAYDVIKRREEEVARRLGESEKELWEGLARLDPRLLALLEQDEEGFVYHARRLYGTIINSVLVADISLCARMLEANNVILAKFIDEGGLERESDELFRVCAVDQGLINAVKDPDGKLRSIPFVRWKIESGDTFRSEYGLSVISVIHYEQVDPEHIVAAPDGYHIGRHVLPDTFRLHINYIGGARSFPYIPLYRVLHDRIDPGARRRLEDRGVRLQPPLDPAEVEGRIVLVGDTSRSGQDYVPTPFSSMQVAAEAGAAEVELDVQGDLQETPGVESHANAIFSILHDTFLVPLSRGGVVILALVLALLGAAFYVQRLGLLPSILLFLLLVSGAVALAYVLFADHYLWIHPTPLLAALGVNFVGGLAYQALASQRKKKAITNIFGKYVSDNLVKKMVAGNLEVDLKGRTQDITVLFSDIRGFTKISEKLDPEMVGTILRAYFSRMISIIFDREGTLDKLMGDAIMAFFGDPDEQPDHPAKACRAALEMLEGLGRLKEESDLPGMKEFSIGIGLNTGTVTVGNLGSDEYVDYTVIGDNVNLGSRLEGLNKEYGTSIIISEFTKERIAGEFETRALGSVRVVGKTRPVAIFELLGLRGEVEEARLRARDAFEKGLGFWHEARFDEALAVFEEMEGKGWNDGPARVFAARCRTMMQTPPEEDWDGVYVPKSK